LFTLAPQRAFAYAGLAAVVLFAAVIGGIYWRHAAPTASKNSASVPTGKGTETVRPPVPQISPSPSPGVVVATHPGSTPHPKKRSVSPPASERGEQARVKLLPGERSYLKTIASLDATIKADINRPMKPSLQAEYERNLAMVDQAIAATRSAAKVNPNDPDAAEFMFAAYQSKIDLLSQVADSRLSNRQR